MPGRLADVAKQAGVSEATVSRVLNGKPGISDTTRAAVLTALDVIGYERPTHLRVRRARMVGLIVPELQNPIFPALAEVVAGALAQRGFNAVLCTRTGSMSEAEYVEMLLERQVSGMIFAGGQYAEADAPHDHYTRLLKLRLPVVLVNAAAEHLDFPRVSTDDAVAMEQAYAHLAYLGHERIGLILGPPDHVPSLRKLAAFEAAQLRGNGQAFAAELVERTRFSLEGGHAAADATDRPRRHGHHLRQRPAGARRDPRGPARGALRALRRLRGRLRRLDVHELHGPAADDGPPADRGDRPGCRRDADRADRGLGGLRRRALLRARDRRPRLHRSCPQLAAERHSATFAGCSASMIRKNMQNFV